MRGLLYIAIWAAVFSIRPVLAAPSFPGLTADSLPVVHRMEHVVIYRDTRFHAAFPSVIKKPDGAVVVAFRRAPDRQVFGEQRTNHTDPNSYLVKMVSPDGVRWTGEPELIHAHPFGGSQDPCLLQLRDGTLLCSSYAWAFLRPGAVDRLRTPFFESGEGVIFLGGYLLRSQDGGATWQGPLQPPHILPEKNFSALGEPLPAYNRGAMLEAKDGRICWVVAAGNDTPKKRTSTHLLISADKGMTWTYAAPVAEDSVASFNETSLYETTGGELVAFLRTAGLDDQACIARSKDGGKSFSPWERMGFQGHPLHALRLPDDRVLLTYGYRHKPYGIRARILNAACTDYRTAPEIILRADGASTDLGYPWSVMLDDKRVLVTYYHHVGNGPKHIAGTILWIGE